MVVMMIPMTTPSKKILVERVIIIPHFLVFRDEVALNLATRNARFTENHDGQRIFLVRLESVIFASNHQAIIVAVNLLRRHGGGHQDFLTIIHEKLHHVSLTWRLSRIAQAIPLSAMVGFEPTIWVFSHVLA